MSGSKVNDFSIGDSNIQSVMLTLDKAYKGLHQVSLTNYDSTSESQIAAGSVVENNGALYQFTSNESITGSPSNGTVYIRLVPDGDNITAEYTNTAPTWSHSKQGWYGTGGDANKRYLEFILTKDSASWLEKESLILFSKNRHNVSGKVSITSQNITTTSETIVEFNVINKQYGCTFGGDYKFQVLDSGIYAFQYTIDPTGSAGAGNHYWSIKSDTQNIFYPTPQPIEMIIDLAGRPGNAVFALNKNDKVWVEFASSASSVNINVTRGYFLIKKIGEF